MDQLEARELINSGWFVSCLYLIIVFSVFVWKEMQHDGWYAQKWNQAAISLLIYFTGEAIARGWAVLLLAKFTEEHDFLAAWSIEEQFPIAMVGALISFVGAVCAVRVFAPPEWGYKTWLPMIIVAAAFMVVTYIY